MNKRIKRSQPLHPSLPPRFRGHVRPANMSRVENMTQEQSETIERLALEIFTDCSNAGCTLGQTMAAILISGMHWGISAMGERNE